jgi:hypothetical protein
MVRVLQSFILVLATLSMLIVAVPTRAQTATDCQPQIAALREATLSATFTGQDATKDEAGLVGKLDSAATKLQQGKGGDAVQALTQFRDKVATLQAQGKIASTDAEALMTGANAAITCIQRPA